ncbi:TRAP transporter small permease subunit [Rhizobium alvei]|uniref:TRAP transporter small permease protein n=1 Tax=Rhizobium alvei TaxID=1132659 RepID=A0ABT8YKN0_9HYPH|nr:TRAP transporter small permease subunit [Rhizobium alvei]MDO6964187.1 TRAP transporter small permease subunit [Rhizobium alvei]
MEALLSFSRGIDAVSRKLGQFADYLVLLCSLISAGNAIVRYLFSYSSNGWLEIQWYMFAAIVLLGASYTLKMNEHVRVDLFYGSVSDRTRLFIDIFGIIFFLLPVTAYFAWACWPFFYGSYLEGEMSPNASGLIRWPVKLVLVIGFAFLFLQGVSELIKRLAALFGKVAIDTKYEKPLQ